MIIIFVMFVMVNTLIIIRNNISKRKNINIYINYKNNLII